VPSDVDPANLFYRNGLTAEFAKLRAMYEPRPTPWSGLTVEERNVTTDSWVAILTAAGITIPEFQSAVAAWVNQDGGEFFPSPLDLLRLSAKSKRRDDARRPIPADRIQCDGTGWMRDDDDDLYPCARCNPALAAVFADPVKRSRWREGAVLADLDVGVEMRRGMLHYIVPLALDHPCSAAPDYTATGARGVEVARKAYADECASQGRAPSWDHFDAVTARIAARAPAPVTVPPDPRITG
jgi:hypothetical protein